MSDTVITTLHEGWTEICLNRPDRLNSFNDEMHAALASVMNAAAVDNQVRAVLLTGSGRGFCAGQDLSARDPSKLKGPPDLSQTLIESYNPLVKLIRSMYKTVICAVNGVAAGAHMAGRTKAGQSRIRQRGYGIGLRRDVAWGHDVLQRHVLLS